MRAWNTAQGWAPSGYDDEGVPARCTPIITDGLFTGYLSNRETAVNIGLKQSGGTMRTESWNRPADHSHDQHQYFARQVGLR